MTIADAGRKYADDVKSVIDYTTPGNGGRVHRRIHSGGRRSHRVPGRVFTAGLRATSARRADVCIADEVQAGFGRTGTHYWGFETQGVVPDIVTMAKGIGNGVPLAAVVTTHEIARTLKSRIHFNTFGGNPVVCAQGKAVLEVIDQEGLQANSLAVGSHLQAGLRQMAQKHNLIGEVRGKGLMIGVELVKDRATKAPAKEETARIFELAKDHGLLIGKGGFFGNVLRIKPPMCLTLADADFLLAVLNLCFEQL